MSAATLPGQYATEGSHVVYRAVPLKATKTKCIISSHKKEALLYLTMTQAIPKSLLFGFENKYILRGSS